MFCVSLLCETFVTKPILFYNIGHIFDMWLKYALATMFSSVSTRHCGKYIPREGGGIFKEKVLGGSENLGVSILHLLYILGVSLLPVWKKGNNTGKDDTTWQVWHPVKKPLTRPRSSRARESLGKSGGENDKIDINIDYIFQKNFIIIYFLSRYILY
jgi:hypothetical protein